MMLAVVIDRFH